MDNEYINKVVEDIFVGGMSKFEMKTELYKGLDEELKCKDRLYLKLIEYKIQQLEDDEMEFTDCIVKGMNEYDSDKNLTDFGEENLACQSGDDDGRELDLGLDTQI